MVEGKSSKKIGDTKKGSIEVTKEGLRRASIAASNWDPTILPPEQNLRFSEFKYRWARKDKVDFHRVTGYTPVNYEDHFAGTGHFTKDSEGHVQLGDCILMSIPIARYLLHQARIRERLDRWETSEKNQLHNEGARLGVETFEDSPEELQEA